MNKNAHDDIKPIKSWHCIDHRPLFDNLISSLDKRGIRENALLEKLDGEGSINVRRLLVDSTKKKDIYVARQREEEEFERRLNNALIASADQGRRSGRLANVAKVSSICTYKSSLDRHNSLILYNKQDEVSKIHKEMEEAKLEFERQLEIENNGPNYRHLTGIDAVAAFESSEDVHTDFSKFCEEGSKQSGLVEMIVSTMLDLEYCCEEMDPWGRTDITRQEWISSIENLAKLYENGSGIVFGPKSKTTCPESPSPSKRQRRSLDSMTSPRESHSSTTLSQVMTVLKV